MHGVKLVSTPPRKSRGSARRGLPLSRAARLEKSTEKKLYCPRNGPFTGRGDDRIRFPARFYMVIDAPADAADLARDLRRRLRVRGGLGPQARGFKGRGGKRVHQ